MYRIKLYRTCKDQHHWQIIDRAGHVTAFADQYYPTRDAALAAATDELAQLQGQTTIPGTERPTPTRQSRLL